MEVNAEVKRGKERQRNSPVDCFDISPKVHSTCDKIHPLPPRRHKLYIACGDFFISFFKIATSLIPLLLLFPKKLTLFVDPDIYFYIISWIRTTNGSEARQKTTEKQSGGLFRLHCLKISRFKTDFS
jgi:hypothetical protein